MDFKNYICPVCNEKFTDDDDVVVCPECGTPHHRECYKKENKCFNSHLHGSDEDLKSTFTVAEDKKENEEEQNDFSLPNEKRGENENSAVPMTEMFKKLTEQINSSPASTNLIGGKPAVYYEIAVKSNQSYYIPRFLGMDRTERKLSVNWFAFMLPLTWSVYRKMYKLSALILAVYLIIFGVTAFNMGGNEEIYSLTEACFQEDADFLQNILQYQYSEGEGQLTENQQKLLEKINETQLPMGVSTVLSILGYAVRFLMGLFANYLYMKKIKSTIESGEKKGLDKEALKAYIFSKNGTMLIIFPVLIGIFEAVTFL